MDVQQHARHEQPGRIERPAIAAKREQHAAHVCPHRVSLAGQRGQPAADPPGSWSRTGNGRIDAARGAGGQPGRA